MSRPDRAAPSVAPSCGSVRTINMPWCTPLVPYNSACSPNKAPTSSRLPTRNVRAEKLLGQSRSAGPPPSILHTPGRPATGTAEASFSRTADHRAWPPSSPTPSVTSLKPNKVESGGSWREISSSGASDVTRAAPQSSSNTIIGCPPAPIPVDSLWRCWCRPSKPSLNVASKAFSKSQVGSRPRLATPAQRILESRSSSLPVRRYHLSLSTQAN
mmetsp:Transcript_143162/g.347765  ORF Transcript_143162/g.347765 Transcript_143162/m.347765 type:complete len:214 (-) Transcript_143162:105-746(-)